jgi:toxin FitB
MFLLDTNVVSELRRKRRAHPAVRAWAEGVSSADLRLSVITGLELDLGRLLIARRDPDQAVRLARWIERTLESYPVLSVDLAVARRAASLHVPDPRQERDALIAATALVHKLTVVTRNVKDFEPMGVPILNPWQGIVT